MYLFLKRNHRALFFATWFILNLVQAYSTELLDDEAYYWVYSRFPAWGYFDHPPMIGLLIRAGYSLFQNELGLRLLVVLLNTATVYLISLLITNRSDKLFYAICGSVAVAQIGGMIAVPDVPLLFFVALFFLMYRRFLADDGLVNCLLLAVSITLMMYTKYHGLLIVLLTLISNPSLFRQYQMYLVTAVSLILFLPHLYWQYQHSFPSVQYHLFERSASVYKLQFTTDYLAGQLALAGPLIGWLLIWASIRYKSTSLLERALQFTLIGFYIFFLASSFKGRVEANWTVPAFVALIVLSHQYLRTRPGTAKWIYRTLPVTLLLVLALRIYMMVDIESGRKIGKDEFHNNRQWIDSVVMRAGNLPVVFLDSYQRPSKFWFYHQAKSLALNTTYYRRNNYNFWPIEEHFIGKKVLVVGDYDSIVLKDRFHIPKLQKSGSAINEFYYSFMKAQFSNVNQVVRGDSVFFDFDISAPAEYIQLFSQPPFDTASIQLSILIKDSIIYYPSRTKAKDIKQSASHVSVSFPLQLPGAVYDARLGISSSVPGHPSLNSPGFKLDTR